MNLQNIENLHKDIEWIKESQQRMVEMLVNLGAMPKDILENREESFILTHKKSLHLADRQVNSVKEAINGIDCLMSAIKETGKKDNYLLTIPLAIAKSHLLEFHKIQKNEYIMILPAPPVKQPPAKIYQFKKR